MKQIYLLSIGILLIATVVHAGWSNKFPVSESVTYTGTMDVLPGHFVDTYLAYTSMVVWEGVDANADTNIYYTLLDFNGATPAFSTTQLSFSEAPSTDPQIILLDSYPLVTWIEPGAHPDSVYVVYRYQGNLQWTAPDTIATIQNPQQTDIAEGGLLAPNNFDVWYHVEGEIGYRTISVNPETGEVQKYGLGGVEYRDFVEDSVSEIGEFSFFKHWDEDFSSPSILSFVRVDTVYTFASGLAYIYSDGAHWTEVEYTADFFPDEEISFAVDRGYNFMPVAVWMSAENDERRITCMYSKEYITGGGYWEWWHTDWDWINLRQFSMQGTAPANLDIRAVRNTGTLLAWDAEVNGSRDIFLRSDDSTEVPEQITDDPGNDVHPRIVHFPSYDDSIHIVVLWDSDRSGESRLWAATSEIPVAVEDETSVPENLQVSQNYPNPFNAETTIKYQVPQPGNIAIDVFNLRGQRIQSEQRSVSAPGNYAFHWNSTDSRGNAVSSGMYLIRLRYESEGNNLHSERIVRAIIVK